MPQLHLNMRHVRNALSVGVAFAIWGSSAWAVGQTDVGRAIADSGGNDLQIRTGDAIFVTCAGLDGTPNKSTDQIALNLRCADMSQQALFLDPTPQLSPLPAADAFGLGRQGQAGIDQYFSLLQQFAGEEASSQGRHVTEGSASQFKGIAARLSAIRRGARQSGIAFNLQGIDVYDTTTNSSPTNSGARAAGVTGGAAGSEEGDLGWAWFGNVEYGFGERDGSALEDGYESDGFGAVFGADYAINLNWVVGGALTIRRADVDFDRASSSAIEDVSGGGLDIDSESLSVFLNYTDGAMFASVIADYGRGEIDMERIINIALPSGGGVAGVQPAVLARAESSTDSDQLALETQIGYGFGEGATNWDVYGGLSMLSLEIDGFSEQGTVLGMTYASQSVDSFEAIAGVSLRHAWSTGGGVFVPYAIAEYRHEFDTSSRTLTARYNLTPRQPGEVFQGETDDFEMPSEKADANFFDVTVGISGQFGNNLAAFVQYNTLLGVADTSVHLFSIGVRGSF